MASERLISLFSPHRSTCSVTCAGNRTALTGSTPPTFLGRPRDFLFTEIDFFMFSVYGKNKPEGSNNFSPALTPTIERVKSMAKANRVHSTPPTNTSSLIAEVSEGLCELESPILRVRNLAYAARMLASSDEMLDGPGAALDALADTMVDELNELSAERERLWRLALASEKGGSHAQD
jgi:hypothetical protein